MWHVSFCFHCLYEAHVDIIYDTLIQFLDYTELTLLCFNNVSVKKDLLIHCLDISHDIMADSQDSPNKRAIVWNHYEKPASTLGTFKAKCNYCFKHITGKDGSTSNLLTHIRVSDFFLTTDAS